MKFKELIKTKKYGEDIFLAMYNKDDKWFYGNFANSPRLEEYYDMEIVKDEDAGLNGKIRHVQFKDYEYALGLDSVRMKKAEAEKRNKSRY